METFLTGLAAVFLMAITFYAQWKIPAFTKGTGKIFATRLLLIVVGAGVGTLAAAAAVAAPQKILAFVVGIGVVHIPAAIILFIKSQRGTGKS